ncbi:MAG: D-2-hydroxyacid dehydrogenase [Pseudomonadales bacterium]
MTNRTGLKIMFIPGLTLPAMADEDLDRIRRAAGADAQVVVCDYPSAEEHIEDVDALLGIIGQKLFSRARRLKWVQSISSGVDSFMYPEFINSPVILTSEKGLVGEHLADHSFGLLLMLTRKLAAAHDLGAAAWQHRPELRADEIELTGRTMGILGLGGTGRAMARRALAFGMQVIALDRDPVAGMAGVDLVIGQDQLEEFLAATDVLAVCCPLTSETNNLLDSANLARLKPGAFLINVTRGEIMVEEALVEHLRSGHLRGAGLDVAPREPLPADSALWQLPNVVMSPHTAGASQFRAQRNIDRFVSNLEKFVAGEPLDGIIDKTLGY